ncbi:hypothetical protein LL946_09590 [Knoellia locipacati]|uniref:hypothetical protein n=1 Tax=Knoellia locipacati TaxID=882824 RepID=UPI00384AE08C
MDDSVLWLVGAVALVVVVAALVWVLRHREDAALPEHHGYDAPEVDASDRGGRGNVTFGADDTAEPTATVDQTVPLSRLGGAGWRDGGAAPEGRTTDAYAGSSPTRGEDPSAEGSDVPLDHHVSIDQSDPNPAVDEELDRRRGGHW